MSKKISEFERITSLHGDDLIYVSQLSSNELNQEYYVSKNIRVDDMMLNDNVHKMLSRQQYDQIQDKDENTLYIISDDLETPLVETEDNARYFPSSIYEKMQNQENPYVDSNINQYTYEAPTNGWFTVGLSSNDRGCFLKAQNQSNMMTVNQISYSKDDMLYITLPIAEYQKIKVSKNASNPNELSVIFIYSYADRDKRSV